MHVHGRTKNCPVQLRRSQGLLDHPLAPMMRHAGRHGAHDRVIDHPVRACRRRSSDDVAAEGHLVRAEGRCDVVDGVGPAERLDQRVRIGQIAVGHVNCGRERGHGLRTSHGTYLHAPCEELGDEGAASLAGGPENSERSDRQTPILRLGAGPWGAGRCHGLLLPAWPYVAPHSIATVRADRPGWRGARSGLWLGAALGCRWSSVAWNRCNDGPPRAEVRKHLAPEGA